MSEFVAFIAPLLVALACAAGLAGVVLVVLTGMQKKREEEWRDQPPLILKLFRAVVDAFSEDARRFMHPVVLKRTQNRLAAGGMGYAILPEEFVVLRIICLMIAASFSALVYYLYAPLRFELMLIVVGLIPIGYYYPDIWLRDRIKQREMRIQKDFPFLLDLLILSMRAGLNYATSMAQSVSRLPAGPIKDEFQKLLREVRAGKPRREALLDLSTRMDVEAVHNFVSAVNQAEEIGGEIGEILYTQGVQRRAERFLQAEAAANKAPVKMLIPLVALLFPILFLLIAFILLVKSAESGILPAGISVLLQ